MNKDLIRQEILAKRLSLSEGFVREASAHIQDDILKSGLWPKHGRVGLYAPIKNEVLTNTLLQVGLESGLHVYFPRVEQGIHFYEVNSIADLERGSFGILEPKIECTELPDDQSFDIVIVPGVVFSKDCHRIGYGKGFYDKFLSHLDQPVVSVGLAYDFQLQANVPVDSHDQALTVVVTEKRMYRRNQGLGVRD